MRALGLWPPLTSEQFPAFLSHVIRLVMFDGRTVRHGQKISLAVFLGENAGVLRSVTERQDKTGFAQHSLGDFSCRLFDPRQSSDASVLTVDFHGKSCSRRSDGWRPGGTPTEGKLNHDPRCVPKPPADSLVRSLRVSLSTPHHPSERPGRRSSQGVCRSSGPISRRADRRRLRQQPVLRRPGRCLVPSEWSGP